MCRKARSSGRTKRKSERRVRGNPLSGCAASPFLSRCAREGGRRQRGGAALARRPLAWAAPVSKDVSAKATSLDGFMNSR
ncbi:hypothetical protein DBR12_11325 [Acidovorax sp. HMWF029]|nr:hypothetical protein DBR12_11325 [Acidovorax sp. HMWF029]